VLAKVSRYPLFQVVGKEDTKMNTNQCDIGLIGLAVMGENLALNLESKGFSVAVFNRTTEVTEKFAAGRANGKNIQPTRTMEEFVAALKKPRIAMMMIKAGKPVDIVIGEVASLLDRGDVLIDGGNSLFTDTQRRGKELEEKGIHFVGMGVSGGEEGALKGPSLMPGGSRESWEIIAPIFRKIAAQVDGEPCCRYMGPDGAGHYVKMVHNGIEYGDIQLICEAYAILKDILEMQVPELGDVFAEWNKGELDSYLIQITSEIFRKIDPETGRPLVDMILDKAGQKEPASGHFSPLSGNLSSFQQLTPPSKRALFRRDKKSGWPHRRFCHNRGLESLRAIERASSMQYATRFTHRKLFLTRREWSFYVLEALNTNGISISATSPPSGGAAASFAPNFSTVSSRHISATLRSTIFCSIVISRGSSKRRSAIGAWRYQQPSNTASLFLHFPHH
jgi:6-phosphogluconate dehydrogenase (decarboxylating)